MYTDKEIDALLLRMIARVPPEFILHPQSINLSPDAIAQTCAQVPLGSLVEPIDECLAEPTRPIRVLAYLIYLHDAGLILPEPNRADIQNLLQAVTQHLPVYFWFQALPCYLAQAGFRVTGKSAD